MGIGPVEGLIVFVILVMLFGPTLIAFWLGYTLGKKRSVTQPDAAPSPAASTPAAASSPDAEAPTGDVADETPAEEHTND